MSRVLVYDCFSGISGDMHIGAMLELGVPEKYLTKELARLGLGDEFLLDVRPGAKLGITGTQATVHLTRDDASPAGKQAQRIGQQDPHEHKHLHESDHRHGHRHLPEIRRIIESAGYAPGVQARALDIFMRIAVAEAKIHGIPVDAVHFHEVGATDAIVDIVAAALCLEYLQIDHAYCAALELGGGMVQCAHGLMPVPAPATAEILTGVPCRYNGVDKEATTPTGAAILTHCVSGFEVPAGFNAQRIGYGVGHKDFRIPNVLRVMIGTVDDNSREKSNTENDELAHGIRSINGLETETNLQIDCNIDDMSPEAYQPLLDRLFENGARDVFFTPIVMKKSRPGVLLSVLSPESGIHSLLRVLFQNSSSIGVRVHAVTKHMLPRAQRSYRTSLGEVRVKIVQLPDGSSRFKVEHDDATRIARATGRNYLQVHRDLEDEVVRLRGDAAEVDTGSTDAGNHDGTDGHHDDHVEPR